MMSGTPSTPRRTIYEKGEKLGQFADNQRLINVVIHLLEFLAEKDNCDHDRLPTSYTISRGRPKKRVRQCAKWQRVLDGGAVAGGCQ